MKKTAPKNFNDCSGCSLCLLVCPVWRRTHDISLTAQGRAKALQNGATASELATSIDSCTLCIACEPVCPEHIGLTALLLDLRRQLAPDLPELQKQLQRPVLHSTPAATLFLPDLPLLERDDLLTRIAALLKNGGEPKRAEDAGTDIALALEAGVGISALRLDSFLAPLRRSSQLIVADGLLLHHLRGWLPKTKMLSLGEALSQLPKVRRSLLPGDLYIIEARAFHSDYERLVRHYDQLRAERNCACNLDLQRIAIPAAVRSLSQRLGKTAADDEVIQGRWLLQGRKISRIVVESVEDGIALQRVTGLPVIHLAELSVLSVESPIPVEAH